MKRVIGLGGVFFKAKDPKALGAWYKEHLGLPVEEWGTMFSMKDTLKMHPGACNLWSPFKNDTRYFEPGKKEFMINFIVADLKALLQALEEEGVKEIKAMEESEYGKFGWIMDPEGNKIELWEPPADE